MGVFVKQEARDFMGPNLSKDTIRRAIILARCAIKLGYTEPQGIVNEDHGDSMTYIFASKDSMAMICCSPSCYLVSHGAKNHLTVGGAEYLIVTNIKTLLTTMKKQKYKSLTKPQLEKLEAEINAARRKDREPDDDELLDIEDDEEN